MLLEQVLLHQNEGRYGSSGSGAGQSQEAEVVLLAMLIADIESCQTDGSTTDIQRADRPDEATEKGCDELIGIAHRVVKDLQREKRRGAPKADDIREAVELASKIGGVAGKPRQASIQRIEHHGEENQIGRNDKAMLADE